MATSPRGIWTGVLAAVVFAGCAAGPEAGSGPDDLRPGKRNVILFLGDGMGVSTVTAARIFAGQQSGQSGEENSLSFERFPNLALIKTYNTDAQVSDSAGTMSAIMTGQKTRIGHISVSAEVPADDCAAALAYPLATLLEQAEDAGFATGVISTARITHATPAATYAHVPNRNWESNSQLPPEAAECRDIARQLLEFDHGDGIEVVLGGGRAPFLPADTVDPEYPEVTGIRSDGRDLTREWSARRAGARYVWNRDGFDALSPRDPAPVLGLFEPSHMKFEADRGADPAGEPSLAEMTEFAIRKLDGNRKGFFLMVEAGRIDHAHHGSNAYRALMDTVALSEAVEVALQATDHAHTLILVTADHSHTLTISGYPRRGNPILGKVVTPQGGPGVDSAGRPYTTLGYANGPGYLEPLPDLTDVDTTDPNYRQLGTFPLQNETHGGEDVAAYATGPGAQSLRGVMEQNQIYDVMRRALMPDADAPRGR
ncbi:MAG: alkaline phosphatase [Roseibium album]|uniref:alkaline phosphatase n=1 Tax=Roseibium album TaxID=311410 RepID=UPI0032EC56F0